MGNVNPFSVAEGGTTASVSRSGSTTEVYSHARKARGSRNELPPPGTVEILECDAAGTPTLARLLIGHGLPGPVESALGMGGTWCYFLADGNGVAVVDPGPRYPLAWCLVQWPAPKRLLAPLPGECQILGTLDRLFRDRPVTCILLTHWHPDHVEEAPALQARLAARWGNPPPLRIAAADRPSRPGWPLAAGAESVFRAAGYIPFSWTWGPDLANGETIGQTGFHVLAIPGHTRGTVALVDDAHRVAIGPTPRYVQSGGGWWTEAPMQFRGSRLAFYEATYGYTHYASHPGGELFDNWPAPPWDRPVKRPSTREPPPPTGK